MRVGIYESKSCRNSILRKPVENKLDVDLTEHCAWCCEAHNFTLKEVVDE